MPWVGAEHDRSEAESLARTGYSLQQEKIQSLKDREKSAAQQTRAQLIHRLEKIRKSYAELKTRNNSFDVSPALSAHELEFDLEQNARLNLEHRTVIEETQKEMSYKIEYSKQNCKSLKIFTLTKTRSLCSGFSNSKSGRASNRSA